MADCVNQVVNQEDKSCKFQVTHATVMLQYHSYLYSEKNSLSIRTTYTPLIKTLFRFQ